MDPLLQAALDARRFAQAPYSGFHVGCAVEDASGRIFTGCNIESASYGLTVCAERVAIFKAISEGATQFRRVVVAGGDTLTPPCGACRQILWEWCRDAQLILVNAAGETRTFTMQEIFPAPFDATCFHRAG